MSSCAQVTDNRKAVNIGSLERLVSGGVGAWLVARGIYKPSVGRLGVSAAGAGLLCRAITGQSRLYRRLHISGSASGRRQDASVPYQTGLKIEKSVIVARPPSELYQFWKNPENLSRFMTRVQSVTPLDSNRWHWTAQSVTGGVVEWDSEIINDVPDSLISWQSVPESAASNAGAVNFKPLQQDRGTEVAMSVEYRPFGGPLGAGIAALIGKNPKTRIARDLYRFKQLIETGEIATTAGQPSGSTTPAVSARTDAGA